MPYDPSPPGNIETVEEVITWVMEELQLLNQAISEEDVIYIRPIYAAPDNPRSGMIVYADGSSWNPGFGEGPYCFVNGTWTPMT